MLARKKVGLLFLRLLVLNGLSSIVFCADLKLPVSTVDYAYWSGVDLEAWEQSLSGTGDLVTTGERRARTIAAAAPVNLKTERRKNRSRHIYSHDFRSALLDLEFWKCLVCEAPIGTRMDQVISHYGSQEIAGLKKPDQAHADKLSPLMTDQKYQSDVAAIKRYFAREANRKHGNTR